MLQVRLFLRLALNVDLFLRSVFQDFLAARFALEDQYEFSGSKVLAVELIKSASCEHFI